MNSFEVSIIDQSLMKKERWNLSEILHTRS